MSESRNYKEILIGEHTDSDMRRRASELERQRQAEIAAQEKAYIDGLLKRNDELVVRAAAKEKEISALSEKITQLININKTQEQKIEELKLENENLLSMCGNQAKQPSAPAPSLFSNLFSMRKK